MLAALAWRNLWRRPQRTLLSVLSVALVAALLVFMLSFQDGVYSAMKETTLRIFDGYAQVQPPGWADDPTIDKAIERPEALAARLRGIPGVSVAAPRVNGFAILANGARSYGAAVIGVDPGREARVTDLPGRMSGGRYLAPGDDDTAVLGDALARNLGLSVGGRVTLLGAARDGSVAADVLRVVGLYHSGIADLDRSILEMPLARAQAAFGMDGAASTIALGGRSLAAVSGALPAARAIAGPAGTLVVDWAELEPAVRDAIDLKYAISMLFYATLVVVVAFILLNTLLMSVLERTREFGVLLALGMRPGQIGVMVWIELFALAGLGCLAGMAIGAGITLWLQAVGVVYPIDPRILAQFGAPRRLRPALTVFSLCLGPGALMFTIALGGVAPFLRVTRLTPILAMRAA